MSGLENLKFLYVANSFLFQLVLIVHFALRKWRFDTAIRYGPLAYALSLPAAGVSVALLLGGEAWTLWLAGFIYLLWAVFGYVVEYRLKIEWRSPIRWPIFGPYVFLYLATVMFYWFPLALVSKPLWYVYAVLFVLSTVLNVTSHRSPTTARAG
jgi:hypothetical protein